MWSKVKQLAPMVELRCPHTPERCPIFDLNKPTKQLYFVIVENAIINDMVKVTPEGGDLSASEALTPSFLPWTI